jgi:hypothetical protein
MKHNQKYDILSRVARRRHHNTQALASLLMISTGDTSVHPSVRITAREQACNKRHAEVYSDYRKLCTGNRVMHRIPLTAGAVCLHS